MEPFSKGRKRDIDLEKNKWENLIENNLKTIGRNSRDRIFASSAGLCERQTAGLMLMNGSEKGEHRKASTQFYFKIGSAVEDVVARAFEKSGKMIDRETRVESIHDDVKVSGRIDFVIEDPTEDELILVELKTCGKLPTKPKPAHLAQLMVYQILTGMPRGLLWYISRNVSDWSGNLKQVIFEIEPSKKELEDVALRLSLGAIYARDNILPERPEHMKKYKCSFCPLIPLCWSGDDVGIKAKRPTHSTKLKLLLEGKKIANELLDNSEWLKTMFIKAIS